jgi:putative phosphoribosyl transferase
VSAPPQFQDRYEAGRILASKLTGHSGDPSLIVLGLPRGGVPVAFEVARALGAPMDVFLVHKLGVPGYEDLAMGAIGSSGVRVLNHEAIHRLGLSGGIVEAIVQERQVELMRRETAYRQGRPCLAVDGRNVLLVDDGVETGSCLRAAIRGLRQRRPNRITVAVPVGPGDTCRQLGAEADDVVCALTPEPFCSIGAWYADFMQVSDLEIERLMGHALEFSSDFSPVSQL